MLFESKEELTKFLDEWWVDRQRKDETLRHEGEMFLLQQETEYPGKYKFPYCHGQVMRSAHNTRE